MCTIFRVRLNDGGLSGKLVFDRILGDVGVLHFRFVFRCVPEIFYGSTINRLVVFDSIRLMIE